MIALSVFYVLIILKIILPHTPVDCLVPPTRVCAPRIGDHRDQALSRESCSQLHGLPSHCVLKNPCVFLSLELAMHLL